MSAANSMPGTRPFSPLGNHHPGGQNGHGAGRAERRMEVRLKKEILGVMFDDLTREEAVQAGAKLLEEDPPRWLRQESMSAANSMPGTRPFRGVPLIFAE